MEFHGKVTRILIPPQAALSAVTSTPEPTCPALRSAHILELDGFRIASVLLPYSRSVWKRRFWFQIAFAELMGDICDTSDVNLTQIHQNRHTPIWTSWIPQSTLRIGPGTRFVVWKVFEVSKSYGKSSIINILCHRVSGDYYRRSSWMVIADQETLQP